MVKVFVDRSRIESFQHCPRERFLQYHEAGRGIVAARRPLPLVVGGAVHSGIEVLLRAMMDEAKVEDFLNGLIPAQMAQLEDQAVAAALADFHDEAQAGLELDLTERTGIAGPAGGFEDYQKQLAASLGTTPEEAGLEQMALRREAAISEFDRYLVAEQSALVEGMVRAYARRRLQPLLEQFEVLEVEREGEWRLSSWKPGWPQAPQDEHDWELWFMSRPDALLRERQTNQLYILSLKTTGAWDVRKERDAGHDMQGLSEGVEVERRLGKWWQVVNSPNRRESMDNHISNPMRDFLLSCPAPPRILAIRYEYLLKGERWKDKELSARLGMDVRSQRSPLIRQYVAVSEPKRGTSNYRVGDVCWAWDYIKDDGTKGSLAWQNWQSQPVWGYGAQGDSGGGSIKEWINWLDDAQSAMSGYDSTVGLEPRSLGWKSRAQALGYTDQHPLDSVFVPPVTVYRNDDELRDWVEQVEAQERRVAEAASLIQAVTDNARTHGDAVDEGERRHLLNVHFPMTRRACSFPSECIFTKLCYGGEDIRRDPIASGQYVGRRVNHPQELETPPRADRG